MLTMASPFVVSADYDYTYSINQITAYAFWSAYGYDLYTPKTYASDQTGINFTGYITDNPSFTPRVYRNSDGAYLGDYTYSTSKSIYYSGGNNCDGSTCHIEYRSVNYNNNPISLTVPANSLSLSFSSNSYIPFLSATTFNRYTGYTSENRFYASPKDAYEVIFFCNKWIADYPVVYIQDGTTTTAQRKSINEVGNVHSENHMYLFQIEVKLPSDKAKQFVTMDFNMDNTYQVIPVYSGWINNMPSDVYLQVFGKEKEMLVSNPSSNELLENGNSNSQNSVSANNSQNNTLSSTVDTINSLESSFVEDMDTAFQDIDFNNDFIGGSSLLRSMSWVRSQYDRMTNNNVIGSFIQYSLLFGLGLLIIGRYKK